VPIPTVLLWRQLELVPDGHTSGMMPFPEDPNKFTELFDGEDKTKLVTGYDATGKNPYPLRITTTMNLMRKINKAIIYVVGENKREALTRLMDPKTNLATIPAAILKEIPGDVYLFTDLDF
jgi:6-phosphogluconolactonase/glucosamine-6-phosphate isomerase/deaminase